MLLTGCVGGIKEVNSDTQAKSVLLSAVSDLAEVDGVIEELDEKKVDEKVLGNLQKRMTTIKANIKSTDMYKDIETVKESYKSTVEKYEKTEKQINKFSKLLEEQKKKAEKEANKSVNK
jgi:hypothetical protein